MCLDNVTKKLYDNPDLYMPLQSFCMTKKQVQDPCGATLVIPAGIGGGKEVVYGKGKEAPIPDHFLEEEDDEDKPAPHLFRYDAKARDLVEKYGYDFTLGEGLFFGRGPRVPPRLAYVPKGKPDDYYRHKRGLGYVSSSDDECCWQVIDQIANKARKGYSSDSSAWGSDASLGEMFKKLMSNMVTVDPTTIEEDDQMPTWKDPWVHHLNMQYGDRFEQREPPTEDQVVQVNMGSEENLRSRYSLATVSYPKRKKS
ncbi:uncharacterized protein A4U43_C08F20340 [Asparagus officinalis]|nr:uncharacterized protein A4U43_C08F20340 [Asparagus officinalis]